MEIKFRYIDNDYIELNKFYNEQIGIAKTGRIANAILIPAVLFLALMIIGKDLDTFIVIPFMAWIIVTIIWLIFNKSIYNYRLGKAFKYTFKNEKLKGIDFYKDTRITLNHEGIKKEIEGIVTHVKWDAVEKVYISEKNIFIRLVNATYINVPIRALKNKSGKEEFLQTINENIKSDFSLIY